MPDDWGGGGNKKGRNGMYTDDGVHWSYFEYNEHWSDDITRSSRMCHIEFEY